MPQFAPFSNFVSLTNRFRPLALASHCIFL
jgi:hypothetical protein